jgi:hypothetical protein
LLTDAKLEALVGKVYALAIEGDIAAARLLLDRVVPPLRGQLAPVKVSLSGSLTDQAGQLLAAAADGALPPDVAADLLRAVESVIRAKAEDEMERRLAELEAKFGDIA